MNTSHKIAIIGLGYVGLPLARLFATKYPTVGFDINQKRIEELRAGKDLTLEVEDDILQSVLVSENPITVNQLNDSSVNQKNGLYCSANLDDIKEENIYIVTVPTPGDK